MSLQDQIAKSFEARANGTMTDFEVGILHQERAKELGISLAKYYDSPEGLKALQAATKASYFQMQFESHTGDGHEVVRQVDALKRANSPKVQHAEPDRAGSGSQSKPGHNGDGMDEVDWNDDEQATKAYRAKKARKEVGNDMGGHQTENRRSRRAVTGDSVNDGPISP
jgi:hypothetical protein